MSYIIHGKKAIIHILKSSSALICIQFISEAFGQIRLETLKDVCYPTSLERALHTGEKLIKSIYLLILPRGNVFASCFALMVS